MARAAANNEQWLVPAVLIGGGYLLYQKKIKPPVKLQQYVRSMRVNVTRVKLKKEGVEFGLQIQNPNSTPITINAVVGDVYLLTKEGQHYKIGNVDKYGSVQIRPAAATVYNFMARLKTIPLINVFNAIFAGKVSGMSLVFDGSVNVDGRVWPIKETVKISG